MPIIQINVWICERCGIHKLTSKEVGQYDDPIVKLDDESWGYTINDQGVECLSCPKCCEVCT